ncbi:MULTISPECIES: hypothetical protein [unclassified Vibrio]|uniref:Uncharacterized protein n=1 Tax=Vibrio sp. HB236076 TaxID=3232307 RepID=A0AB39HFY5_9VIBR|nr:hypothetical protein [Vibrio sp. HB161653]MDP5255160.1 hypothetical protein [Vibrio sp. HB161653]
MSPKHAVLLVLVGLSALLFWPRSESTPPTLEAKPSTRPVSESVLANKPWRHREPVTHVIHARVGDAVKGGVKTSPSETSFTIEPKSDQEAQAISTSNEVLSAHTVFTSAPEAATPTPGNRKPVVNPVVYAQLKKQIAQWDITPGNRFSYRLDTTGLFEDPEGNFLTLRSHTDHTGIRLYQSGSWRIQGAISATQAPVSAALSFAARDSYHGVEEEAWVEVSFSLPISDDDSERAHPLIDDVLYRLNSSETFNNQLYEYQVVYCESFLLTNNVVYYAQSESQSTCPSRDQLAPIGSYQRISATVSDTDDLELSLQSDRLASQRWQVKWQYEADANGGESVLTSTYDGANYHSYSFIKDQSAMEQRLTVSTGLSTDITAFPYPLLDENGDYFISSSGNYIAEERLWGNTYVDSLYTMESDMNIQSAERSLYCEQYLPYFESSEVGGVGEYGTIISSSATSDSAIECDEFWHPYWNQYFIFLDLDFDDYAEFIDGNRYSYVLQPKVQYRDRLEAFRINLIYHKPEDSAY